MSAKTQKLPRPHKRPRQEVDSAVSKLNARIVTISENTLPKQPYLLSVPSDVPYNHSHRFVQTWYVGTPFSRREEQLQYLSFLPHDGEYEELLKAEGAWADEDGSFLEEQQRVEPAQSVPGTPSDQPNRKKISLKDYKKEKAQADGTSTPLKPVEDKRSPKLPVTETVKKPTMSQVSPEQREMKHERGRSPVRAADRKAPIPQSDGTGATVPKNDPESSRPLKKRKLSESPPPKVQVDKKLPPKQLPKLLSPTLPSSPVRNNELPELLSPLLPPSLMRALATPPSTNSSDSNNTHRRSDSVRSILGSINDDGVRTSDKNSLSAGAVGGSRVRSDSQHSARSATSATSRVLSRPGLKTGVATPNRSPGPRQRHTIVLKYGKKNRKRVEALLKFKPRPKTLKPAVSTPELTKKDATEPVKKEAAKTLPAKDIPKAAVERGTSPDRPISRSKPPLAEAIKRPSTPLMNGIKDVKRAASPATKALTATPKKEIRPTAMRRVESVEGGDPSTPGSKPRASTPASVDRSSRIPKSSPLPSSSTDHDSTQQQTEHRAWQIFEKDRGYFTFARKLKHEGCTLLDKATNTNEMHKPILLIIEALLGFMMNIATMYSVRPRTNEWSSILGYYLFVLGRVRSFPHLNGLVLQLGAVCRQRIHKGHLDRLARDPLPSEEHTGAAPTPGSDGTAKTSGREDAEGSRKAYLANRDELIQNAAELETSWLKGSRLLSTELLMKEYPETWRARSRDFEQRGVEKVVPNGTTGVARGYYLPLDPATSAFEAVEYALKVMGEWADREDVDWRARLVL